jgi:hypothetical protein
MRRSCLIFGAGYGDTGVLPEFFLEGLSFLLFSDFPVELDEFSGPLIFLGGQFHLVLCVLQELDGPAAVLLNFCL